MRTKYFAAVVAIIVATGTVKGQAGLDVFQFSKPPQRDTVHIIYNCNAKTGKTTNAIFWKVTNDPGEGLFVIDKSVNNSEYETIAFRKIKRSKYNGQYFFVDKDGMSSRTCKYRICRISRTSSQFSLSEEIEIRQTPLFKKFVRQVLTGLEKIQSIYKS